MKDFVNGSDKFSIRLLSPDGTFEILNFSCKYQALHEYDETTSVRHKFTDGDIKKKALFSNLSWQIDFSEWVQKSDALLINKLKNAEFESRRIFLTPHVDYPYREFEVHIVDNKRTLSIQCQRWNYGYILDFEAVHALKSSDWIDPDFIPAISAETYFEI